MNNILVTGGAGFIGSNLCEKLLENSNNYVVCLDNLFTGRNKNIANLRENDRFEFLIGDIVDTKTYRLLLEKYNFKEIYNLACPASPPHYQLDPVKTLQTNFIGMYNMLELAKANNAKILQTSTSEVYGDPLVHPQPEVYRGNVNPDGIRACYDEGKRVAETLCFEYLRQYNVDIKVIRIFNTYGVNMRPDDGRVVSNFICQALTGEDITIYGTGEQTRSFCYVDDLVRGLIAMMNSAEHGPINLGNPGEFTINELANLVVNMIPTKSKLVYKDLPSDDPVVRKPVIKLANEKLNWEPTINLSDGLVKTIEYFKGEI